MIAQTGFVTVASVACRMKVLTSILERSKSADDRSLEDSLKEILACRRGACIDKLDVVSGEYDLDGLEHFDIDFRRSPELPHDKCMPWQ